MARNPFLRADSPATETLVSRFITILRTFLGSLTVAQLRERLVAAGLPQALADQVTRLDEIPDLVVAALLARIPDAGIRAEVRRRLEL
jgi:hypothetical protein